MMNYSAHRWVAVDFSDLAQEHLTLLYKRLDDGRWQGYLSGPADIDQATGLIATASFEAGAEPALLQQAQEYVRTHYARQRA